LDTVGLWQAILGEIEVSVSKGNYVTWFKNTRLLKIKNGTVTIGAPNVFITQHLENKFGELIKDLLIKNGVEPENIEYKILPSSSINRRVVDDNVLRIPNNQASSTTTDTPVFQASSLTHSYRQGLNERYNFENFIVGSGNELAYAACQAVATTPGEKYNPLFLYGGVGIGKTHLIQAVGNAIISADRNKRIVYVSSEQFVQEFLDAIRFKKNTEFAHRYRNADVLIIDDMQFIAGKEKTQEEFFHTFNALHQANKQIIITSDVPPKEIPTLTDRLRSRFEWGMAIDMQAPDFETRCAIVQEKSATRGLSLPHDVVEYLASYVQTNIRELEGALNQLIATCEVRKVDPNIDIAMALLGKTRSRPKHLTSKMIIEKTAKYFHLEMTDILGPKRDREIVIPRQIAMYLLRNELKMSFPKIAKELGRKDHTTAIHSVEKINNDQLFDDDIKDAISNIKERLYA
jgi:chromosomal replication initiator protein